ncbi:MAG: arylsulfatase B [Bacteroidia bacterium]|jgi:arylsulfatase B
MQLSKRNTILVTMKNERYILGLLAIVLLSSCGSDKNPTPTTNDVTKPNILLIIADDMGKDATFGFTEGSIKPNTPNINAIKNAGLTFSNVWVNPTCSPTRASIITGKYGYRTGVKWAGDVLPTTETILHKYISEQTNNAYATAIVGKWHLSGVSNTVNPESFGMDYYAGIASGAVPDYYNWTLSEDGSTSNQTQYATEFLTNLAINWVESQDKPWFLWLAYNAPHTPFHVPPSEMHSQGELPAYSAGLDAVPYYMAAIEAMDYQIGRLISSIPANELENTIILFIGDNGTPNQVAQKPYSNQTVKGTIFQGGINTPMFISGKGVTRTGTDNNLISSTDLFTTIANLAGARVTERFDSKSFATLLTTPDSIRKYQYSEMDDGTRDAWTISNGSFKLMVDVSGNEQMYNLLEDPYEEKDLLLGSLTSSQAVAKNELENELGKIRQ